MAAAGRQRRSEEKEEEVVTEDDVGVGSTRDENGTMVGEDGYVRGRMEGVERKQRR